jgi:UDP-N-acetylglucosamine 1-carboxyvinyltransferase
LKTTTLENPECCESVYEYELGKYIGGDGAMDRILVEGGEKLHGEVKVSGAKNAALPIMTASILCDGPVKLRNIPCLRDIDGMERLLCSLGIEIKRNGDDVLNINPRTLRWQEAPYDLVRKMRASFCVLGPMISKYGKARVSLPGGCAIGSRPVDIHLKALTALGIDIHVEHGYVEAEALSGRVLGSRVVLDFPSVGATENVLMAASLALGTTELCNAAREPEVTDLAGFLNACGAKITGAGTDKITIEGVDSMPGGEYDVIPDRIEAGTFMVAAGITGGDIKILGANLEHNQALVERLRECGVKITEESDGSVRVVGPERPKALDEVITQPYPGFPTDMQAQLMALLTIADGTSLIKETIFENRFMHTSELTRMGADLNVDGNCTLVRGVEKLSSSPVMASDLRASAALVLAALVASGETEILRVYHLDRGYEKLDAKLSGLGARIRRVSSRGADRAAS